MLYNIRLSSYKRDGRLFCRKSGDECHAKEQAVMIKVQKSGGGVSVC